MTCGERSSKLNVRIATLTERGEMWAQYNKYKPIRRQLARVKPEKRELFEQRHSRELILYDAAARYLKELKASGEELSPEGMAARDRPADCPEAGRQHRHEGHAGGTESRGTAPARPPTNWPGRNGTSPATGGPER